MGNTIYSQKTFPTRSINTSEYELLTAMERAEGTLLTASTLGESLRRAGMTFLVVSAASFGFSFLLNHPLDNGAINQPGRHSARGSEGARGEGARVVCRGGAQRRAQLMAG